MVLTRLASWSNEFTRERERQAARKREVKLGEEIQLREKDSRRC